MSMKIIRAETTAERAGAYYVRIHAMAVKHHISLYQEFDEHDSPDSKYIVITDDVLQVATCRWYQLDAESAMIGRVVVLPDYRGRGLGRHVMQAAEAWLRDLGYRSAVIERRDVLVGFYEKLGYIVTNGAVIHGDTFDCIRMEKSLR